MFIIAATQASSWNIMRLSLKINLLYKTIRHKPFKSHNLPVWLIISINLHQDIIFHIAIFLFLHLIKAGLCKQISRPNQPSPITICLPVSLGNQISLTSLKFAKNDSDLPIWNTWLSLERYNEYHYELEEPESTWRQRLVRSEMYQNHCAVFLSHFFRTHCRHY